MVATHSSTDGRGPVRESKACCIAPTRSSSESMSVPSRSKRITGAEWPGSVGWTDGVEFTDGIECTDGVDCVGGVEWTDGVEFTDGVGWADGVEWRDGIEWRGVEGMCEE